jgi:hypothetical protein
MEENECRHAECPYGGKKYERGMGCFWSLMSDALSLLKEQKAVEPDTNSAGTCTCGTCGETVGYYPAGCNIPRKLCKFCPECGRAVKWE